MPQERMSLSDWMQFLYKIIEKRDKYSTMIVTILFSFIAVFVAILGIIIATDQIENEEFFKLVIKGIENFIWLIIFLMILFFSLNMVISSKLSKAYFANSLLQEILDTEFTDTDNLRDRWKSWRRFDFIRNRLPFELNPGSITLGSFLITLTFLFWIMFMILLKKDDPFCFFYGFLFIISISGFNFWLATR